MSEQDQKYNKQGGSSTSSVNAGGRPLPFLCTPVGEYSRSKV